MEDSDIKIKNLIDEKEEQRTDYKNEIEELEKIHTKNLLNCYKRNDELKESLDDLRTSNQEDYEMISDEYSKTLKDVEEEYQNKYEHLFERFSSALSNMKLDQRKFQETLLQSEEEFEQLLQETKQELLKDLEEEIKISEDCRAMNSKLQKENEKFKDRQIFLETMIKDTEDQIAQMKSEMERFQEKYNDMVVREFF